MQDFYEFKRRNNFIKIPAVTLVSSLQRRNVHLLFKQTLHFVGGLEQLKSKNGTKQSTM